MKNHINDLDLDSIKTICKRKARIYYWSSIGIAVIWALLLCYIYRSSILDNASKPMQDFANNLFIITPIVAFGIYMWGAGWFAVSKGYSRSYGIFICFFKNLNYLHKLEDRSDHTLIRYRTVRENVMDMLFFLKKIWRYTLKSYLISVTILTGTGVMLIFNGIKHEKGIGFGRYEIKSYWSFDPIFIGIGSAIIVLAFLIYKNVNQN